MREKKASSCSSIIAKSSSSRGFKELSREIIDQSRTSSSKSYSQSNMKSTSTLTLTPYNNNNWNSRRNMMPKEDNSPELSDPQLVLRKAFHIPSSSKSMNSTSSNRMTSSLTPPPKVYMKAKLPTIFSPLSRTRRDMCHKCNKQVSYYLDTNISVV